MHDVVVVGGGSAGCVVAARLTEDDRVRVALIEAGRAYEPATMPSELLDVTDNVYAGHHWGLEYVPVEGGPSGPFLRGRVLGGSGAINTAVALRCDPSDAGIWAANGAASLAWDRLLPVFCALESDREFGDAPYHGRSGPLPITRYAPDELSETQRRFVEAALERGHPPMEDANRPGARGVGPLPMNRVGRVRVPSASAFLDPARARANLDIRCGELVDRLDVRAGRAEALVLASGERMVADQFVLCAGSVGTPGILERSGIGDAGHLASIGISVQVDRPGVGENLCDHPVVIIPAEADESCGLERSSPKVQAFVRSTSEGGDVEDDLYLSPFSYFRRDSPRHAIALAARCEVARSCGSIHVTSADAMANPLIRSRLLCDTADARIVESGVREALALLHSKPMRRIVRGTAADRLGPAELRSFVRENVASGYHPAGTARMGADDDELAVVDDGGRVFGIENVVVADASVLPTIPRSNINLTVMAVAHLLASAMHERLSSGLV